MVPSPHSLKVVISCQSMLLSTICCTLKRHSFSSRRGKRGVAMSALQKPGEIANECGGLMLTAVPGPY